MTAAGESARRCTNGRFSTTPLNPAGLAAGRIWVSKRCRSTLRNSGMSMGMRWVCLFPRLVDHCDQRFWGWAITRQIEAKFLQAIVDRHSPELPQEVHPDQQCRALTQSPNIED